MTAVKICGLSEPLTLKAACDSGAHFVGFVFHPASPRHISVEDAASLARMVPTGVRAVALFVDPDNAFLDNVLGAVPLDMIQLHGEETPARVAEIRARCGLLMMKAIRVGAAEDLAPVPDFVAVADWLLFDAKSSEAPGGTGHAFDWHLLKGRSFTKPWMLGGGLNAENVEQALKILKPDAVDVSSGVERTRGVKDEEKIRTFIEAVRQADL